MVIVLREKDPEVSDFGCRDGEIEYVSAHISGDDQADDSSSTAEGEMEATTGYGIRFSLTAEGDYPAVNIRVPLESGDEEKVTLMLQGQMSRVDAAAAERITQNIVRRAAEEFSRMVTDYRRVGLHMLPFRVFGMIENKEGAMQYPSAQAVMLPCETPPHPEIMASSIHEGTLTLSLRFAVKPHRLSVTPPSGLQEGERVAVFASYPLYIPKSEEITGTPGSVRSAGGGNSFGIRFHFLSTGRIKHSVAAPEKYYRLIGNENTGVHMSSKAAELPCYGGYAARYGYVRPFPADCLRQTGSDIEPDEWIADWEKSGNGYMPRSLPYIYRNEQSSGGIENEGIDMGYVANIVEATGCGHVLLTRPMTFADAERSRRKALARGVRMMRIHGLPAGDCVAVLFGSDDGVEFGALRVWDPHFTTHVFSPRRMWHRLMLLSKMDFGSMAIEIE